MNLSVMLRVPSFRFPRRNSLNFQSHRAPSARRSLRHDISAPSNAAGTSTCTRKWHDLDYGCVTNQRWGGGSFDDEVVPFRSSIELDTFQLSIHARAIVYEASSAQYPLLRLQRIFICATNHGHVFHPMFGDALDDAEPFSSNLNRVHSFVMSFFTKNSRVRHSDVYSLLDVYTCDFICISLCSAPYMPIP
jgi:hypothetical protein